MQIEIVSTVVLALLFFWAMNLVAASFAIAATRKIAIRQRVLALVVVIAAAAVISFTS